MYNRVSRHLAFAHPHADLLAKYNAGYALDKYEKRLFATHPALGAKLVRNLPRLENIAEMIARQNDTLEDEFYQPLKKLSPAVIGGQLLRIALFLDQTVRNGASYGEALEKATRRKDMRRDMLVAMRGLEFETRAKDSRVVQLKELRAGHALADDVYSSTGSLLVPKDQVLKETLLERLRTFKDTIGIQEPIRIKILLTEEDEAS